MPRRANDISEHSKLGSNTWTIQEQHVHLPTTAAASSSDRVTARTVVVASVGSSTGTNWVPFKRRYGLEYNVALEKETMLLSPMVHNLKSATGSAGRDIHRKRKGGEIKKKQSTRTQKSAIERTG